MKKKLLVAVLSIALVFAVTGCSFKKATNNDYVAPNSNKAHENSKVKTKCSVLDCIKKLSASSTVEDIDKVVGIKGELTTDSSYKVYTWTFSDKEKLTATYYSSGSANIEATYIKDNIKNKKVTFSKYSEIQTALKSSTSLTYDEFKQKVGGVEGTLVYISSSSNKYVWVSTTGEYLTATFSNTTNKCTFVLGQIRK